MPPSTDINKEIMKPLYLCSILLLAGCAPAPKYLVPAGAPHALIRSELVSMENHRNSVSLVEAPPIGCKYGRTVATAPGGQLVSVYKNVSTPEGFFPIEAGKPLLGDARRGQCQSLVQRSVCQRICAGRTLRDQRRHCRQPGRAERLLH